MSSSNRTPQSPARRMSPFPSPNGFKIATDGQQASTTGGWIEPPLRQPVPSFQDHGLGRVGVVENMMPLGTSPTTRVKARTKGDPLRKVIQARHLSGSGMVLDDSRSTPEAMAEIVRTGSARTDGQTSSNIDPQLMTEQMDFPDFPEPTYRPQTPSDMSGLAHAGPADEPRSPQLGLLTEARQQQPQVAQMHPFQAQEQTPQQYQRQTATQSVPHATPNSHHSQPAAFPFASSTSSASMVYSPSTVPPNSPFFTANSIAKRNGRPEVQQPLAYLYSALQQDPELEHLLRQAMQDTSAEDPVNDRQSELGRKIRRVKKNYRAQQAANPLYRNPFTMSVGAENQRQASTAFGQPLKNNQTTMGTSSPQPSLHQHLRATSSSLPQRLSSSKMASHGMQSAPGDDAPSGQPLLSSRRASSSSLSSTSSRKIEALEPSAAQATSLKRTVDEAGSLLDAADEHMEAQRKRMRRDFSSVDVSDSSVRKVPPQAHQSTSSPGQALSPPRSGPKLRYWPPGIRTEVGEASETGAGESPATPTALGRPPSSKKKVAPRTKMSPIKNERKASVAGLARPETRRRASPGDDDKIEVPVDEEEEDDDVCAACGGPGLLICCDDCDRSFHFDCLDPPRSPDDSFEGEWLCPRCEAQRDTLDRPPQGLFADLGYNIEKSNPRSFTLPQFIRDYYKDIRTGSDGEYITAAEQRPIKGGRIGYDNDNIPDYRKTRDAKGNPILCYSCGKSALGGRDIIPCDFCQLNWHLDCLNPPLANPPYRGNFSNAEHKTRPAWMCPAHADHEVKTLDPVNGGVAPPAQLPTGAKKHRVRRPVKSTVVPVHMRRGFANNGMIEVDSESDDSGFESDENQEGVVFKLPSHGIKLDFIDKVKQKRLAIERSQREAGASLHIQAERLRITNEQHLSQDIEKRHFAERVAAFNLVQFRESNQELKLGRDELETLVHTLIAEAPPEVVAAMSSHQATQPQPAFNYETRHKKKRRPAAATPKGLPSPSPTASRAMSEVKNPNERQREILLRMQTQIQQMLAATDDTTDQVNGM